MRTGRGSNLDHFDEIRYDARRYDEPRCAHLLPPACGALARRSGAGGDRDALQGARRPRTREDRQPARDARRSRLCLRVRAARRPRPADRQPPSEEADRGGAAATRAAGQVGVLLPRRAGDASPRRSRPASGGDPMTMSADTLREQVRAHYAESALACGGGSCCADASTGARLYGEEQRAEAPARASEASLGCGNPVAVAELHEGETVLDLGSGGGLDVILSARRVG